MLIDPFRLAVATLPLGIYLLLLGGINVQRRPLLTTGSRDFTVLALAVLGLMIVGPLQLFMPQMAAMRFGSYVWAFLLVLYGLCIWLVVLLARPRLVIYNIRLDVLRPVLADVVARIDPNARWAGDNLVLSRKRKSGADGEAVTQLHVEYFPIMRLVSLIAIGPHQSVGLWRQLETGLAAALGDVRGDPNPLGWLLLAIALLLVVAPTAYMAYDPLAVAQGMRDVLLQ